ncbi:CCNB1IP1, partial [Symbiodinium sp. CCMP2592]
MELPCSQGSDLSAEGKHSEHPSLLFRCNFQEKDGKPCEQPLDKGWVTACSHLFCNEHAHRWFASHDSCPVCGTNPVKLVRMDLSRASLRRRGTSCLVGMSPPEVLRALEVSLSFWTDQQLLRFQQEGRRRAQEVGRLACIERTGKARLMEAEELCNELEKKHGCMENKLAETLREVSELNDELSRISESVHQASRGGLHPERAATAQSQNETGFDHPPVRQSQFHEIATGMVLHLVVDCLTFEDFLYNATHGIAAANSRRQPRPNPFRYGVQLNSMHTVQPYAWRLHQSIFQDLKLGKDRAGTIASRIAMVVTRCSFALTFFVQFLLLAVGFQQQQSLQPSPNRDSCPWHWTRWQTRQHTDYCQPDDEGRRLQPLQSVPCPSHVREASEECLQMSVCDMHPGCGHR